MMFPTFPTPAGATPAGACPGRKIDPASLAESILAPFHPDLIEWRAGALSQDRAQAFPYVDARAIMRRLDEVAGPGGWQGAPYEIAPGQIGYALAIFISGQWVTKADGAYAGDLEVRDGEARDGRAAAKAAQEREKSAKGAISSALKRAAAAWGFARYLYDLGDIWEDVEVRDGRVKGFTKAAKARLYEKVERIYFDHHNARAGRHEAAAKTFLSKNDLTSAHGAAKAAIVIRANIFGEGDETTARARAILADIERRMALANGTATPTVEPPPHVAPVAPPPASPPGPVEPPPPSLADLLVQFAEAKSPDVVTAIAKPAYSRFGNDPAFRKGLEAAMQRFVPKWTIASAAAAKKNAPPSQDGAPPAARPPDDAKPAPDAKPARARRRDK